MTSVPEDIAAKGELSLKTTEWRIYRFRRDLLNTLAANPDCSDGVKAAGQRAIDGLSEITEHIRRWLDKMPDDPGRCAMLMTTLVEVTTDMLDAWRASQSVGQ